MSDDIEIQIGATFRRTRTVTDANGQPVNDLTQYDFRMQVRESENADPPLLDLSTDNGKITRGAGEITFECTDAETGAITVLGGVYDTEVTDPFGNVTYPDSMKGRVTFNPRRTR